MRCSYHVHAEMEQVISRAPFRKLSMNSDEPLDRERITLRCPVEGCYVVGRFYDPDKRDRQTHYTRRIGERRKGRK